MNGTYTFGVFAKASGGTNNYGLYADAPMGVANSWAGYFNGNVYVSGNITEASDANLKENIQNIPNATQIINNLQTHTFYYRTNEYNYLSLAQGKQYGLIAQEVETILPELVKEAIHPEERDSLGNITRPSLTFKTLDYNAFIPILIQGVKEVNTKNDSVVAILNTRIDSLQNVISNFNTRMNQFENQLNDCCNNGHNGHHGGNKSSSNLTEVVLENSNTVLLEQNVPNPFAESTTINYYIPENIKYTQLLFSDNFGRIIKTVDIETSGAGTIKVYASNLSQGTYTYSLVVDGKVVETKKMVCVK